VKNNHNSFTMIELMIVIAIIAILASLLLPALNKAKKMAYSVSCISNLNQQGLGFEMYASDFDGMWPAVNAALGSAGSGYFLLRDNNYISSYKILDCDGDSTRKPGTDFNGWSGENGVSINRSYNVERSLGYRNNDASPKYYHNAFIPANFKDVSRILCVFEDDYDFNGYAYSSSYEDWGGTLSSTHLTLLAKVLTRHSALNMLMADGHVIEAKLSPGSSTINILRWGNNRKEGIIIAATGSR